MDPHDVAIQLPPEMLAGLKSLAAERNVTPGQLVRNLLEREIARGAAKRPKRADEQRVARLQRLLAPTMAAATTWGDLRARLQGHGFALRPASGGLTLHDSQGARLCKSSELGFAYSRLVKRFAAPMSGHPHKMAHLLTQQAAEEDPDDLVLIEPFD